jgi:cyclophilin family peptidyl-prolyl cis-trans isomerase
MVVKKGTVGIVSYRVYKDPSACEPESDSWTEVRDVPGPDKSLLVDFRERFRFRFGMNEIHSAIEKLLETSAKVCAKHRGYIYLVEVAPESEAPVSMTPDEIFVELVQLKTLGNDFLKTGALEDAYRSYGEAIALMTSPDFNRRTERDVKEVYVPLYLNQALCCLKRNLIGEAIECCNSVLEVDPRNVKALFRRGSARLENHQIGAAKRDLLFALSVEPSNKEIQEKLENVKIAEKKATNEAEQSLYRKMVHSPRSRVHMTFAIGERTESLVIELYDDVVPRTVQNFMDLLTKYAGCSVFKLAKDQLFQTGDYDFNDGSGGNAVVVDRTVAGRSFINDENLSGKHDRKGVLGMANYGPNTGASQFYITLGECPDLDGTHVVFGQVVEGIQTLDSINSTAPPDWLQDTRPSVPIVLIKVDLVK